MNFQGHIVTQEMSLSYMTEQLRLPVGIENFEKYENLIFIMVCLMDFILLEIRSYVKSMWVSIRLYLFH